MLSPSPDEPCEIPFWAQKLRPTRSSREPASWSKSFKNIVPAAIEVGHGLLRSLQQNPAMKWPYQASPSILNQAITQRRHLEVSTFSLSKVMDWAHRHNASLNDILLCLTGTALHRYLEQHSKGGPESLHALIPVSLRSQEHSDPGCRLGFAVADLGSRDASQTEMAINWNRSFLFLCLAMANH
jgi:hypothetical protein